MCFAAFAVLIHQSDDPLVFLSHPFNLELHTAINFSGPIAHECGCGGSLSSRIFSFASGFYPPGEINAPCHKGALFSKPLLWKRVLPRFPSLSASSIFPFKKGSFKISHNWNLKIQAAALMGTETFMTTARARISLFCGTLIYNPPSGSANYESRYLQKHLLPRNRHLHASLLATYEFRNFP